VSAIPLEKAEKSVAKLPAIVAQIERLLDDLHCAGQQIARAYCRLITLPETADVGRAEDEPEASRSLEARLSAVVRKLERDVRDFQSLARLFDEAI
jgi:hypothetical protein